MSQIIEAASRTLAQTGVSIQKSLVGLSATIEAQIAAIQSNANEIADQEAAMATNVKNIESQIRESAAEIRLQVREDATQVLANLLNDRGLITRTPGELLELERRAKDAESNAAKLTEDAVKSAESKLHASYKAEIASVKAANEVAIATYKANASADATKNELLAEQVEQLRADLKAEREARVAMAESAAKAQGVTVNTAK